MKMKEVFSTKGHQTSSCLYVNTPLPIENCQPDKISTHSCVFPCMLKVRKLDIISLLNAYRHENMNYQRI